MHSTDNGIRRDDQRVASRRGQERRVVGQAKRAGMPGDRLEVSRDQPVLG